MSMGSSPLRVRCTEHISRSSPAAASQSGWFAVLTDIGSVRINSSAIQNVSTFFCLDFNAAARSLGTDVSLRNRARAAKGRLDCTSPRTEDADARTGAAARYCGTF